MTRQREILMLGNPTGYYEDDDAPPVAILNITTPEGILLDRLELTADDLRHADSIGRRVIEGLPASVRPHCRSHEQFAAWCCACADLNA